MLNICMVIQQRYIAAVVDDAEPGQEPLSKNILWACFHRDLPIFFVECLFAGKLQQAGISCRHYAVCLLFLICNVCFFHIILDEGTNVTVTISLSRQITNI